MMPTDTADALNRINELGQRINFVSDKLKNLIQLFQEKLTSDMKLVEHLNERITHIEDRVKELTP